MDVDDLADVIRTLMSAAWEGATMAPVAGRVLYLVGGPPRVGKSTLALRLVQTERIPWLPTDVVRTVLRRVLAELDAIDQDPVDAERLAEAMYPHIEQAAEVCAEEAERFVIEGFEVSPWYPARLRAALDGVEIRACFLGHRTFSARDLASYRGPKPQHENEASPAALSEAAAWIRQRSHQVAHQCREAALPYIDVGEHGFEYAMQQACHHLLTPRAGRS